MVHNIIKKERRRCLGKVTLGGHFNTTRPLKCPTNQECFAHPRVPVDTHVTPGPLDLVNVPNLARRQSARIFLDLHSNKLVHGERTYSPL